MWSYFTGTTGRRSTPRVAGRRGHRCGTRPGRHCGYSAGDSVRRVNLRVWPEAAGAVVRIFFFFISFPSNGVMRLTRGAHYFRTRKLIFLKYFFYDIISSLYETTLLRKS